MGDTGQQAGDRPALDRERPVTPPPAGRGAFALPFPLAAALTPVLTVAAIAVGGSLHLAAVTEPWAGTFMLVALVALGAPVILRTLGGLLRGQFAADVVAMLAIATAIVLREPLAGLVIVLMQTGGEALGGLGGRLSPY